MNMTINEFGPSSRNNNGAVSRNRRLSPGDILAEARANQLSRSRSRDPNSSLMRGGVDETIMLHGERGRLTVDGGICDRREFGPRESNGGNGNNIGGARGELMNNSQINGQKDRTDSQMTNTIIRSLLNDSNCFRSGNGDEGRDITIIQGSNGGNSSSGGSDAYRSGEMQRELFPGNHPGNNGNNQGNQANQQGNHNGTNGNYHLTEEMLNNQNMMQQQQNMQQNGNNQNGNNQNMQFNQNMQHQQTQNNQMMNQMQQHANQQFGMQNQNMNNQQRGTSQQRRPSIMDRLSPRGTNTAFTPATVPALSPLNPLNLSQWQQGASLVNPCSPRFPNQNLNMTTQNITTMPQANNNNGNNNTNVPQTTASLVMQQPRAPSLSHGPSLMGTRQTPRMDAMTNLRQRANSGLVSRMTPMTTASFCPPSRVGNGNAARALSVSAQPSPVENGQNIDNQNQQVQNNQQQVSQQQPQPIQPPKTTTCASLSGTLTSSSFVRLNPATAGGGCTPRLTPSAIKGLAPFKGLQPVQVPNANQNQNSSQNTQNNPNANQQNANQQQNGQTQQNQVQKPHPFRPSMTGSERPAAVTATPLLSPSFLNLSALNTARSPNAANASGQLSKSMMASVGMNNQMNQQQTMNNQMNQQQMNLQNSMRAQRSPNTSGAMSGAMTNLASPPTTLPNNVLSPDDPTNTTVGSCITRESVSNITGRYPNPANPAQSIQQAMHQQAILSGAVKSNALPGSSTCSQSETSQLDIMSSGHCSSSDASGHCGSSDIDAESLQNLLLKTDNRNHINDTMDTPMNGEIEFLKFAVSDTRKQLQESQKETELLKVTCAKYEEQIQSLVRRVITLQVH